MGERPKGPMPEDWRPTTAVGNALLLDILERLDQHRREDTLPRSPRGLFYDLRPSGMGHGLTYVKQPAMVRVGNANRKADPTHMSPADVQEMLVKARRAGLVRENWIEDTRAPRPDVPYYDDTTAEEEAESILNLIRNPSLDYSPQDGQPVHLELLVEAAGLIGRIARVAGPYGVPVYSGGGFDGLKGKRALAQRAADRDVPTIVLRITDYDEHGLRIAESSALDSHAWAVRYYGAEPDQLEFRRIALTEQQAVDADLLDTAGKAEADGLPVPVMDAIVRDAIEDEQDPDIRQENADRADRERARITGLVLAALNGGDQ